MHIISGRWTWIGDDCLFRVYVIKDGKFFVVDSASMLTCDIESVMRGLNL